ncbi:hypothetical protein CQW23_01471 [Capsicum baccatum]|uniref:Retrovirus-related Pol polyprotein from transposon TNT 1-94-like beta-barrel domain-containing protein n=1 Tax=Capsicum baccatum TaxID=33114 RepID=A0A2G2XNQ0_CAPBA|nr:hypothetical protein CQW23_01471 [Capsicum baccatum]
MDYLCAMLSECNLVGNHREWWMDSDATRHVCANKELFATFTLAQGEEKIYMANSATAKVGGIRKVRLKMTLGKVLTLNNVLRRCKTGMRLVCVDAMQIAIGIGQYHLLPQTGRRSAQTGRRCSGLRLELVLK